MFENVIIDGINQFAAIRANTTASDNPYINVPYWPQKKCELDMNVSDFDTNNTRMNLTNL